MAAVDVAAPPRSDVPASMKIAFAVMVAVLVLAPLPPFQVYPVFLMKALCFALFACAFNLLIGYGGLLSFGHAMFFGWASYVCAHLAKVGTVSLPYWAGEWNWLSIPFPAQSPALAIFGGSLVAGILGVIVGAVAIRRQGIYFAMITLALAQMMYFFALQAKFTGGEDGIQGVPRGKLFGIIDLSDTMTMYVVVVVIFLTLPFFLIYRIVHSPFGEVLKAIRENEPRAISLGYKTERYKLGAFVLSAVFAGTGRRHQGAGVPARFAHRRALDDVRRGGADDARRRPRHHLRPGGGRDDHRRHADLFRELRRMGAGDPEGAIFVVCVLAFRRGVVGELAARLRIKL